MNDIAISVRNLSKKYRLYDTPQHRLKEALHPFRKKFHRDFWALRDISFEVKKGETVGIIGKNGSGKSTLLQIICGILKPSEGEVMVNGRISALLELGAGFNPEFTGRQNVYMNSALMGLSREEVDSRFDDIASFADIGEFIDQPVKTYSSGMYVRLAFATAINVDPEILIVDEALAVGDMFFRAKCMMRMKKMLDSGTTLLFVSHDTASVKSLCSKALLLDNGLLLDFNKADNVVEKYFAMRVESEQKVIGIFLNDKSGLMTSALGELTENKKRSAFVNNAGFQKRAAFQRIQNGKANFVNIQLLDEVENEIQSVEYEQNVILRMSIEVNEDMHLLHYGYHIRDKNSVSIVNSSSVIENTPITVPKKGDKYIIDWRFKVSLMDGPYTIACVLSEPIDLEIAKVDFCDYVPLAVQFEMQKMKTWRLYGYIHWANSVKISRLEAGGFGE